MRDVSEAGHELGRARLDDLPPELSLGELLRRRIRDDVERYNADPGRVFDGLVQPADAVRHSDGHHLRSPRPLDADRLTTAALEAAAAGMLWFVVGDRTLTDLEHRIDPDAHDEVTVVLRRPVVARVDGTV